MSEMTNEQIADGQLRQQVAAAIHYPQCWDTAAYPTLDAALHEAGEDLRCSECARLRAPAAPPEITDAMAEAGARSIIKGQETRLSWADEARLCFKAMLNAAPAPSGVSAPAAGVPAEWREFVENVAQQTPEKPDYWSSCGQCERNSETAQELLAAAAPAPNAQPSEEMTDKERIAFDRFDKPEWAACSNLRLRVLLSLCHETITQCGAKIENLQDDLAATHAAPAANAQPSELPPAQDGRETDLSKRLRQIFNSWHLPAQGFDPRFLLQAAEEIERYYGGMLAWKQTAETKDRQFREEMTARVNERIAARAQSDSAGDARDAARYRWLKSNGMVFCWDVEYRKPFATIRAIGDRNVMAHFGGDVDAAIDAAIAASAATKGEQK